MAQEWDQNGKPITVSSTAREWDESGKPIAGPASPGAAPSIISPQSSPSLSAAKPREGMFAKVAGYLGDVGDDIRHGTGATLPGRALKAMGAPGTDSGVSHETGEYMGSIPLGLVRAAQGAAQIPATGVPLMTGVKNLVGGVSQAATMPLQLAAGAQGEAAVNAIPNAARAGENLGEIKRAASAIPVDVERPGAIALRMKELEQTGSTMPKVARQFAERVTNPDKGPLMFPESRDFASNAGRLSIAERLRTQGEMGGQVKQLAKALSEANRDALPEDLRPAYDSAMKEYRQAKQIRNAAGVAGAAALGATKAGAVYELAKKALGSN